MWLSKMNSLDKHTNLPVVDGWELAEGGWAWRPETLQDELKIILEGPVITNSTNSDIIQPIVKDSRMLSNLNPCSDYRNLTMMLTSSDNVELPNLALVFDRFADEGCQNGTIAEEKIDIRLGVRQCFIVLSDDGGPVLDCGAVGNGQDGTKINVFSILLLLASIT